MLICLASSPVALDVQPSVWSLKLRWCTHIFLGSFNCGLLTKYVNYTSFILYFNGMVSTTTGIGMENQILLKMDKKLFNPSTFLALILKDVAYQIDNSSQENSDSGFST